MGKLYLLLCFLLVAASADAQQWLKEIHQKGHEDSTKGANFYQVQKAFYKYEKKEKKREEKEREKGRGKKEIDEDEGDEVGGYNEYKRWEWFCQSRVYPSGYSPSVLDLLAENQKFQTLKTTANNSVNSPSAWINLTSTVLPGRSTGVGRINCMAFMPGNSNSILVGTACGGVWKSTNGGIGWTVLNTDQLPALSIADIAINPHDTNTIYIATGDNYGLGTGFGILQGHYSAGVYKSTNGGSSWSPTGTTYLQSQQFVPQRLLIDPNQPDTLFLASNVGIFRTVDGGGSWGPAAIKNGNFYSLEFNPLNAAVLYATDGSGLYRSNDHGSTWNFKGGSYPNIARGRVTLAVTPADTNYVYLWGPTAGFKRTINGGTSFQTTSNSTITNPDGLVTPTGYYDRGVVVSPVNKQEVFVSGIQSARTTNGGVQWNLSSDYTDHQAVNYIHQDVKRINFAPGSGTDAFALTDGGIFKTTNAGANWTNLSAGLEIGELYRLACHPFSADTILCGKQDCSSNRVTLNSHLTTEMSSGDGMQPLYNYINPSNQFVSKFSGNMQKSTNWGSQFDLASAGQAWWVASFVMNLVNPNTIYCGTNAGVKKSYSEGTFLTWFNVSAGSIDSVLCVAVTKQDTNYVFAAKYNKIVKSSNGGNTWVDITGTLPVASTYINYITVSPSDTNKIYVVLSGYVPGRKVYRSLDCGKTWGAYSGTLPNVPVNCIKYVSGSNDALYIGTDFGVFYRDASMADWSSFNVGLPNVIVNHLDIFYGTKKLRAATYGRGIWEIDIPITGVPATPQISANGSTSICEGATVTLTSSFASGNQWYLDGLPINNATGASYVASIAGDYTVVVTNAVSSSLPSSSVTVAINPIPSTPSVSANGNLAICEGNNLTLSSSSATGNQWYKNGLPIVSATNNTYNASASGDYTVVVTSNTCPSAASAAITIVVNAIPATPTVTAGGSTSICSGNSVTLSSSSAAGNQWYKNSALLVGATNQDLVATISGGYSVVVTSNNCISLPSSTINVIATVMPSATISYGGSPYCSSAGTATVTHTGTADGSYTSTAGLSINNSTGAIDLSASVPGSYTVTYTVASSGGCATYLTTASVTINAAPSATISYQGTPYCSSAGTATVVHTGTAGGTYTSTAGLSINPSTGAIDLAASVAGIYTVTYTVASSGGCATFITTTSVTISAASSATISYGGSPYCSNAGAATVTRTGTAGGTYTSTAGLSINASTGTIDLGASVPGSYTVTYTVGSSGGCATFITTTSITISAAPSATISYANATYPNAGTATVIQTGTTGGIYSSTVGLNINSNTGTIDLAGSAPGAYTVTYTIAANGCGQLSTATSITILSSGITYTTPMCQVGQYLPVRTVAAGGTYSATPSGLSLNTTTGSIAPALSTAGSYLITYNIPGGGIANFSVTVLQTPKATITPPVAVCQSDASIPLSYSIIAGAPTTYSISADPSAPMAGFAAVTNALLPVSGPIVVTIPSGTAGGTYKFFITMKNAQGCISTKMSFNLMVMSAQSTTISYNTPMCQTGQNLPTRTGASGGVFSSTPGLTLNSTTGLISPASSTPGTYTVNYAVTTVGGCTFIAATSVTVVATPKFTVTTPESVCQSATSFKLPYSVSSGTPVSYSITADATASMPGFNPVGDAALPISGPINVTIPQGSAGGTYKFAIIVKNAQGCISAKVTFNLMVISLLSTTISYASPMCQTGQNLPTRTGVSGGVYSSTPGLTLNSTNGLISPAASTPGTYTVSYSVTTAGGCAFMATTSVTIVATPKLSPGAATTVCQSANATTSMLPYTVTAGTPVTYSLTAGANNPMPGFIVIQNAPLASSPILINIPAGTLAGTYYFNLSVKTTQGCSSGNYVIGVKVINCNTVAGSGGSVTSPGRTTGATNKGITTMNACLDNNIIIAPNPVQGRMTIYVRGLEGLLTARITNAEGKEVRRSVEFTSSCSIDMSGYAGGMYVVEVVNQKTGEVLRRKIVKQ